MATQLTFRRGTSEPTQASGLTLGEPAFNTTLNTLHIGRGAGITATWVGAQISGLSTGIAAGLTYQVPTMSAVKDYVASTTSGVATLNSLTGAVTIAGGTNIGVTTAGSSITVTNLGVQTFNGLTGAVGGVTTSAANTFTALNTFNAGITTSFLYASTGSTFGGTLRVNGGTTLGGRVDVVGVLDVAGGVTLESTLDVSGAARFANGLTSSGSIKFNGSEPKEIFSNTAPLSIVGVTGGGAENSIILPVDNSALLLGSATGNVNIVNNQIYAAVPGLRILTDDFDVIGPFGTIIKPGAYATAERTQTLQNASGVIALTSQLMGAVNGSTAATNAVTSFNGLTGAVTGASLGANTFTALNTFNAGISAAGGVTFAGDIAVNGGDITTTSATATVFNTTATNLSIGSAATTLTMGATSGTAAIQNPILTLGNDTGTIKSKNGTLSLQSSTATSPSGSLPNITIDNTENGLGFVSIMGGNLYLGWKQDDVAAYSPVNIVFEGEDSDEFDTTLTVDNPTANRTIALPNASGTVALTSQLMGAVNGSTAATNAVTSFNGLTGAVQGVSAAVAGTGISVSGATGAVTITNIGVQSFNGATGAVTGASLGANTFTGLNTFNAGITTSFLYASTGSTFGGRVDLIGILDVGGGVTLESTLDVAGVSRFTAGITTSTLNASGAIRANAGLTASTLDVSGAARTTGDVTVGATLTVNGNFQVYGTLTTVNRTDLNIDDKTITMGRTLANDALADGGGLSLSGTAARTWTWSNTRSAWESNQGVNVASTYGYAVNGTSVLTSNTLGSGVTGSSLTAVGTLTTGVWQATAIGATYGGTGITSYTIGDVIYANGTSSLAKLGGVTAGYLLSANGTGTAPEYKQLLVKDGGGTSIATITSASGTLTATIQYATASLKGVASFDNTNFTVSTGAVTITGVDGGTY